MRDSARSGILYASTATKPVGCVHIPVVTELWDKLETPGWGSDNSSRSVRSREVLRMLQSDFSQHPTWSSPGHRVPLTRSAFTKWSEDIDPFCGGVHPSVADRSRDQIDLKRALESVLLGGPRNDTFIDSVATELERNQVVSVSMPAGWGKSITSLAIFRELVKREEEGREAAAARSGRVYDYGSIRRTCAEMEKALHLTPTPSNVVSVVSYLKKLTTQQPSFTGLINQSFDYEGRVHGDFDGKDYIVAPYNDAERVLANGRFKLLILDEAHADVAAISSCLLRALDSMGGAEEDALCYPSIRKRRVSKILILRGVRSTALDSELERLIASQHGLRYKSLILPSPSDSDWNCHRRELIRCCLHGAACTCAARALPGGLSNVIAAYFNGPSDDMLKVEDEPLVGGVYVLPSGMMSRLMKATRKLMSMIINAQEIKTGPGNRRYDTILVYVPTSGVGEDLKSRLRDAPENFVFSSDRTEYFWAYNVKVCSSQCEVETELTEEAFTRPNWTGRPYDRINNRYMGTVLIVVNGAERGITIPHVGGIVESGIEWMRVQYNRHGLNSNVFLLSDRELVAQRAGRGGRTTRTWHVTCLSPWGHEQLEQRGSAILMRMRSAQVRQAEFSRIVAEPRLAKSPLLRELYIGDFLSEGRINGTLVECGGEGCAHNETQTAVAYTDRVPHEIRLSSHEEVMDVSEEAKVNMWMFSGIDPALSKLLTQFISCKMTAYGLIKVAMLVNGVTGLAKPPANSDAVGPTSSCNSLDIFSKGNCGSVRYSRRPRPYAGDSLAVVEMHMQLIAAARWNFIDDVPKRAQLIKARPPMENFCSADWLTRCTDQNVLDRMDHTKKNEKLNIQFILRLFSEQERVAIWSTARKLLQDAYAAGIFPSLTDALSHTFNQRVHNLTVDPIMTMEGRALFNAVLAAGSTRFAKVITTSRPKADGAGKTGACTAEYYNDGGAPFKVDRAVRADSAWDLGRWDTEEWIRFDSTETNKKDLMDENVDRSIVTADPMTEWQMLLFGNLNGRWRVFPVNSEADACTFWRLEVEANACCALFGFSYEDTEDVMRALINFRIFASSALSLCRGLPSNRDHDAALTAISKLWETASADRNPGALPMQYYFT